MSNQGQLPSIFIYRLEVQVSRRLPHVHVVTYVHVVSSDIVSKFMPRTSEVHIFRKRALFFMLFISTCRLDYALKLSFRLRQLILTFTFNIIFLVGRDRENSVKNS